MKKRSKRRKPCKAVSVVLLTGMLLGSPSLLTGCALFKKDIVLHPITGQDIVLLKAGETVTAPNQGAFLSDFYIEEVMKVKVTNG